MNFQMKAFAQGLRNINGGGSGKGKRNKFEVVNPVSSRDERVLPS